MKENEEGLSARLKALEHRIYRFGKYCGICGDSVESYWDLVEHRDKGIIYVCQECRKDSLDKYKY